MALLSGDLPHLCWSGYHSQCHWHSLTINYSPICGFVPKLWQSPSPNSLYSKHVEGEGCRKHLDGLHALQCCYSGIMV